MMLTGRVKMNRSSLPVNVSRLKEVEGLGGKDSEVYPAFPAACGGMECLHQKQPDLEHAGRQLCTAHSPA